MHRLPLSLLVVCAAACGHVPPASTEGVPPPWPQPRAAAPSAPAPALAPSPSAPPTPDEPFRSSAPTQASDPPLALPTPVRRKLSNGTPVLIVERPRLPVASVLVVWPVGVGDEPPEQAGLAGLTADLLDEGAGPRGALELAGELERLGARLDTSARWDATTVSLTTLTRTLDPALALLSDVLRRPTFAEREVERVRNDRVTTLLQQRDSPGLLANDLLSGAIYGAKHRYGQPLLGTEASLKALGPKDVARWHKERLGPGAATVIVVGAVQPDDVLERLERGLRGWTGERRTTPKAPVALPPTVRRVLLVDRPGAAQTEVRLGEPGVDRRSADYFPLLVTNAILGGQFTSRLNLNLREKHGYTYGARTEVAFRKAGGPLAAAAPVKTAVTRPALEETLAELERIRTGPVTAAELRLAKDMLRRQLARTFETPPECALALATLRVYGLPDDYYATYPEKIEAVTPAEVQRVARARINPAQMVIVLVGDAAQIATPVAAVVGEPQRIDPFGRPLAK